MDEYFEIPVTYRGEELSFNSRLIMSGYTHKFEVNVNDQLIFFEPDDSGNYRAIVDQSQLNNNLKFDSELLKAIAGVIESIRNN